MGKMKTELYWGGEIKKKQNTYIYIYKGLFGEGWAVSGGAGREAGWAIWSQMPDRGGKGLGESADGGPRGGMHIVWGFPEVPRERDYLINQVWEIKPQAWVIQKSLEFSH